MKSKTCALLAEVSTGIILEYPLLLSYPPQFKRNLMAVQLNVTLESDNVHVIATGKNYIIGRRNYVNI